MKKSFIITMVLLLLASTSFVFGHCEIPCGIYGDQLRFELMKEHATTIEKSMKQIEKLGGESSVNYNQLVRWISNKEEHAEKLREIAVQYFLAQRVKPASMDDKEAYKKYQMQLEQIHHLVFYSMKVKQTTDLEYVGKLRKVIDEFYDGYFTEEQKKHAKEHSH